MPFNGNDSIEQIDTSMNSILMLNASCQAVIEAEIQEVESSWYEQIDQELGIAEDLVLDWRRSGVLYFQTDILDAVSASGDFFLSSQAVINTLFTLLNEGFSAETKARLIAALQALQPPVQQLTDQVAVYLVKLRIFEMAMETPQSNMEITIAQVQAAEQQLQSEINIINLKIKELTTQIETDREAIAKARRERDAGIGETIFGVLLAPFTGGASLILAGIGVASIGEAEDLINNLQSQISDSQQTIANDQGTLSSDQKIVVTLNGLTMSTGLVLSDIGNINSALDSLRISWIVLNGELNGVLQQLGSATSAADTVVIQAWYDSACLQWNLIVDHVASLSNQQISTTRVMIG